MSAPARVRAAFKAAGFNTRQVSVASPRGNVKVTVRSLLVPFAWAKELAGQAESVRYCEASGEMLLGGNTFVDVEHSELCRNQLAARYLGVVIETAEKVLKCDDGSGYSIPGVTRPDGQSIHLMKHRYWLRVCDGQFGACDYDPSDLPSIAYRLALLDPDQSTAMLPSVALGQ